MEEILASIRRIISEDDRAGDGNAEGGAPAGNESRSEDVLELTQVVRDDGSTIDLSKEPAEDDSEPARTPDPEAPVEPAPDDTLDVPIGEPEEAAEAAEAADDVPPGDEAGDLGLRDDDLLISDEAASASVEALSRLGEAVEAEAARSQTGAFGRSVDDLVLEALRPMLREWLDRNLPGLIERIVEREIRRLVRQSEPD